MHRYKLKDYIKSEDNMNENKEFTLTHKYDYLYSKYCLLDKKYIKLRDKDIIEKSYGNDIINRKIYKRFYNNMATEEDKIILQQTVIMNIELYIYKYFPKCYSAFKNSLNNNTEYAYLNIGLTDGGYISGIPVYNIKENKSKIYMKIRDIFSNMLNRDILAIIDSSSKIIKMQTDLSEIDIEIHELEPCNNAISITDSNEVQDIINSTNWESARYKIMKKENNIEINKYLVEIKKWKKRLYKYGCKLDDILDNMKIRSEYIDFVKLVYSDRIIDAKPEMSNQNIVIMTQYKLKLNTEITLRYTDHDYILKKFRDMKKEEILKYKPEKPKKIKNINTELMGFLRLTPLIDIIIKNIDITYIWIRIRIPLDNKNKLKNTLIAYKETEDTYCIKKRVIKKVCGIESPENITI